MAILKILTVGDELLRKKCKPVDNINSRIIKLLDDLKDTLLKAEGVGLAAPQVGVLRRIFVIDEFKGEEHKVIDFINPKIVKTEGHQENPEGCLSIPGKYGITSRPAVVTIEATDRNGNIFTYTANDLYARCLCHENDHLDGILYIDNALEMLDNEDIEE